MIAYPRGTDLASRPSAAAGGDRGQRRDASPETTRADACVVGGGPAGVVLAFLLARQGVRVVLLEAQRDFDRDFRGDSLHPPVMELMDSLGLADRLLEIEHAKAARVRAISDGEVNVIADLGRLRRTRFPYYVLMQQARFLEVLLAEAKRYPGFDLRTRARVEALIEEDGAVRGVRYRHPDGRPREVRVNLVVGADGRYSKVRRLAGIGLRKLSPGGDVLYFKLPRLPEDPPDAVLDFHFGPTAYLALIDRGSYWQAGYGIPKGGYEEAKAAGVGPIKDFVGRSVPWLSDRLDAALADWRRVTLMSVEIARAERWHRPGLLLIGDAAHVMSASGGVGINLAVQDAIAAANALTEPLRGGGVGAKDLARVRRRRGWQAALIQAVQGAAEKANEKAFADGSKKPSGPPAALLRLPLLRELTAWLSAYGAWPERLKPALVGEAPRGPGGSREEEPERTPGFEVLRGHRYMNLTTFRKKSGEGVVTPVWFAEETQGSSGGRLYVYTTVGSGKVKRVRNDGRVLVGPSDVRGRPLGPEVAGEARLLPPGEAAVAEGRLRRKYGLQKRLFELLERLPGLTHGGRAYLEISPARRDGPR